MGNWGAIYNNATYLLQVHAGKLAALQEQAASGARVNRPSDDPSDAYRILALRAQANSLQNYAENLDDVDRNLETSQDVLQQVSTSLIEVRQLTTQVISGTYGPDARGTIAEQINSILDQAFSLANTKSLGRYLFGGTKASSAPYVGERVNGRLTAVEYQGSLDNLPVPVAPGVEYPGLVIGERAFRAGERQAPLFMGETGAACGSATSNVRGSLYLTVVHNQTSYPGGTGIAAGTSSPTGDTIIGEHVLTVAVDGPNKTISLDGGAAVTFEGGEQDLAVTSAAGDVVYVNVENWAGFEGDIAISATGRLSVDGGASYTELTAFTDNVAVTDSRTGRILYVDATALLRTGVEPVRVPGTGDLFGTLIHLRDLLLNEPGLPDDQHQELMAQALEPLDEVAEVVTRAMTSLGGRLQAMDVMRESLESIQFRTGQQADMLEDADIVQVAADLARTQILYEMTMAVASKLLTLSLLDFI